MKRALVNAWLLLTILGSSAAAFAQDKLEDKGAGFSDDLITERVTSALHGDPELKEMRILVRTRGRVVHLRGVVESVAQADRAEALARGVEGVTAVRSMIHVVARPSRA